MESNNEYLISEEEFKTLDIDNISEILLKDGTTLKFNQNTNKILIYVHVIKQITLQEIVIHL